MQLRINPGHDLAGTEQWQAIAFRQRSIQFLRVQILQAADLVNQQGTIAGGLGSRLAQHVWRHKAQFDVNVIAVGNKLDIAMFAARYALVAAIDVFHQHLA